MFIFPHIDFSAGTMRRGATIQGLFTSHTYVVEVNTGGQIQIFVEVNTGGENIFYLFSLKLVDFQKILKIDIQTIWSTHSI